MNPPWRLYT